MEGSVARREAFVRGQRHSWNRFEVAEELAEQRAGKTRGTIGL